SLGLALQGGMHLDMEVRTDKAIENEVIRAKDDIRSLLNKKKIWARSVERRENNDIVIRFLSPELKDQGRSLIEKYYPDWIVENTAAEDAKTLRLRLKEEAKQQIADLAVRQAREVIERRINPEGVKELPIQTMGRNRIIVELPGVEDPEAARRIIERTGQLSFHMVLETAPNEQALLDRHGGKIPDGTMVLMGNENGRTVAFLLEKEAKVTGADLKDARVGYDEYGQIAVNFELNSKGAKRFGLLTGKNIGKRLAIVLEGKVQSAPVIRSKITDRGQITGNFTPEEAQELQIVLRSGAMPAPVEFRYQSIVGPSLGSDSIRRGVRAAAIGGVLVVLFMVLYYKLSGVIADLALVLNMIYILAVLAGFQATLTLPGIAGIVLTIGMAVDANVLIFERIREELRTGKTPRTAIEGGFSKALLTILDANVTTVIAAVVLFQFGTGPVKGFAVTLTIGIIASLFTALFVARLIFDFLTIRIGIKKVSI
ncbi:MAG: protein translocase subunit SecD, partial [Deltaproteobacteria bacterium]|nr:protein translocase subunit SecD [Deltaproteobacteria bacterium]